MIRPLSSVNFIGQVAPQHTQRAVQLISALSFQLRTPFIASKEPGSNFLQKVTGYEQDPETRKNLTQSFKQLGMKWNPDIKGWVATSTPVEYEKIRGMIEQVKTEQPSAPVVTKGTPSQYERRVDSLFKEWEERLSAQLPSQIDKPTFLNSLKSAILEAEKIGTPSSDKALYIACSKCANLGLVPSMLNEVYFSSRGGEIEALLGYKGIMTLARRAYPNVIFEAEVIREGDEFEFALGTKPFVNLRQSDIGTKGEITHAYAMIRFPNGIEKLSVIDAEHAQKRKACSKGANSPTSPWARFPREMWLKTALRDVLRYVSLSTEQSTKMDKDSLYRIHKALEEELLSFKENA